MAKAFKKLMDVIMLRKLQDCRLIVEQTGNIKVYFLSASMQRFMLVSLFSFMLAFILLCAYTFQLGYSNHQLLNTISDLDGRQPAVKAMPEDGQAMQASAEIPVLMNLQQTAPAETEKRLMIFETNINIALR